MRVITFTGKGGVGKTSISAATAFRLSELGYKTLIMSTDPAHSLSDSFELKLNCEPTLVKPNLWAIEVNAYEDLKRNWHAVQGYYSRLLSMQGIPPIMADEMTVLPGMEELFSLMRVKRYKEGGKYDALILDTAPTGETLRLLSLPEAMNWGVKLARTVEKFVLKPVARPLSKMSDKFAYVVPSEEVMKSIDTLFEELDGVKEILTDAETASVRLVMNPEKMVIKETMRALTYLNLYGFKVDMVTVNKLLAEDEDSGYLEKWKQVQRRYLVEIEEAFAPLPIKKVKMYDDEVVGFKALERLARDVYGDENPAAMMYHETPIQFIRHDDSCEILLKLPFANPDEIDSWVSGDELFIQIGNQRKIITLPVTLAGAEPSDAKFKGQWLSMRFPTQESIAKAAV
ncbi:MAG: TRC40/GET3/ArsA family transport-energizing ATPase [Chloroherpetonaceae bacterium]|nr:TRC40/GET3/ArsA family transport-energizing ATPase [Chloroherpetonaceae bacterium]